MDVQATRANRVHEFTGVTNTNGTGDAADLMKHVKIQPRVQIKDGGVECASWNTNDVDYHALF